MKIKVDAKVLEEVVSTAAQAISNKMIRPSDECVFFDIGEHNGTPVMTVQGHGDGLKIQKSTDSVIVMEDGCALIPAKMLLAFLKLMDGDVTLEADGQKAVLKCGGKKTSISCMDASDFSTDFTIMQDERLVKMNGDDFEKAVSGTLHCISPDQGRLILTGINFSFDAVSGLCEAVGTDGFRLAMARVKAETNDTFRATIPAVMAKLIAKTIKGSKDVEFRFSNGAVIVDDYDTRIEAALLSGEYMDVHLLIEKQGAGDMHIKANASDLMEATKLAMIPATDNQKGVIVMGFEKEESMQVFSRSDFSDANTTVSCERMGEMKDATEIAFNGKYIEDALKAAMDYGGELTLKANTNVSPLVIVPVNRDDYYQLVLPVRRFTN